MKTYTVQADITLATVHTSVRSAGGRGTADPGQFVVTFADGTQAVFPGPSLFAEVVFHELQVNEDEKPKPKTPAKTKGK